MGGIYFQVTVVIFHFLQQPAHLPVTFPTTLMDNLTFKSCCRAGVVGVLPSNNRKLGYHHKRLHSKHSSTCKDALYWIISLVHLGWLVNSDWQWLSKDSGWGLLFTSPSTGDARGWTWNCPHTKHDLQMNYSVSLY